MIIIILVIFSHKNQLLSLHYAGSLEIQMLFFIYTNFRRNQVQQLTNITEEQYIQYNKTRLPLTDKNGSDIGQTYRQTNINKHTNKQTDRQTCI